MSACEAPPLTPRARPAAISRTDSERGAAVGSRGDLVRAINAGAEAGRNGAPVTSCPFPVGDLRRFA
ncbi:Rmf/CrpP fold protein [Streptomyces umbrinus]|uniref:Rmf/CrpP fold protein n=1 Tax=Streptomyces umbrinus TaxID=67370 RepID=UPI0027D77AC5|nr:Rmf/CrpP fold protein [Streptomyces umbrinus]